jgi:hypothetical protein
MNRGTQDSNIPKDDSLIFQKIFPFTYRVRVPPALKTMPQPQSETWRIRKCLKSTVISVAKINDTCYILK